ncbi:MAG: hypothetical protein AAF548_16540 [Actinomycetota bacterium]
MRRPLRHARALIATIALVASLLVGASTPAAAAPPSLDLFEGSVSDTNLITLEWDASDAYWNVVYIEEDRLYGATPIGLEPADCGPANCTATQRVRNGGVHRFTITVWPSPGEDPINQTIEVDVPVFEAPAVPVTDVRVDFWNPVDHTITWTAPPTGNVQTKLGTILEPGPWINHGPGAGSLVVPGADVAPHDTDTYSVRRCDTIGGETICSAPVKVEFARPAAAVESFRVSTVEGSSADISWTGDGQLYAISAPTLGHSSWTTSSQVTIPASSTAGKAGLHEIEITSCSFTAGFVCSNQVDGPHGPTTEVITAPASGTLTRTPGENDPRYVPNTGEPQSHVIGQIDAGSPFDVVATFGGLLAWTVPDGASVQAGDTIATMTQTRNARAQLIVEPSAAPVSWTVRDWSDDYSGATHSVAHDQSAANALLDVTVDEEGDIWAVGEFSRGIVRVDDGTVEGHLVPTGVVTTTAGGLDQEPILPFVRSGTSDRTAVSVGGERVIAAGRSIFWTRGDIYSATEADDFAQIVEFDLDAVDDPATHYDDRMCVIHVPQLATGAHDSHLYGIAWDGQRIWAAETRFGEGNTSSLVSFAFDGTTHAMTCDNELDYNNPAAVAAADSANLCAAGSPGPSCMSRVELGAVESGSATHIEVDPVDGTLWLTGGLYRSTLGHHDPATGATTWYQLPWANKSDFGNSYPWQLRVDTDAVWIGEWYDVDLIRFDKATAGPACEVGTAGPSPCIGEVHLPATTGDGMHSIALDDQGRLWFTNHQRVGYFDTATWGTANPTGVIYEGLETLFGHPSRLTGIEIAPDGRVVFNGSHGTKQIAELTPLN